LKGTYFVLLAEPVTEVLDLRSSKSYLDLPLQLSWQSNAPEYSEGKLPAIVLRWVDDLKPWETIVTFKFPNHSMESVSLPDQHD